MHACLGKAQTITESANAVTSETDFLFPVVHTISAATKAKGVSFLLFRHLPSMNEALIAVKDPPHCSKESKHWR